MNQNLMRLAFAVFTGYLIFAVSSVALFQLTQQDPHAVPGLKFVLLSVAWGMAFAALGGFVASRGASRGASRTDLLASGLVGGLIASIALVSLVADHENAIWSQLAAILLMAPSAWAAGLIKRRRQNSDTTGVVRDPSS